ncbi:hypothetical protein Hanom_Chr05g00458221 [Helianthus anomalus]
MSLFWRQCYPRPYWSESADGESGSGAGVDKGKDPIEAESRLSSDSDDEDTATEHFLTNDDLDKDDEVEGIVEDWKLDDEIAENIDHVEVAKGDSIVYTLETIPGVESVDVNLDDIREYVFADAPPEEILNPEKVPEEVRQADGISLLHPIQPIKSPT